MKFRKMMLAAPILVVALGLGGAAYGLGSNGFGGPHNGAHGYGPGGKLEWAFGRGSAPLGIVSSFDGATLGVQAFDGATVDYAVVPVKTKYVLNGVLATSAAVVTGEDVIVYAGKGWGGWSGGTKATTPLALIVFLFSPHAGGTIQSLTSNSTGELIVVQDLQGFWRPIQTNGSTVFYANGVADPTPPTLTTGEVVAAIGSVASDHETLDATQVNVITPPTHKHHH
jgi:hypothetical protein